jgi:hypothetical protein
MSRHLPDNLYQTGKYEHQAWKDGIGWMLRELGPYNPSTPVDEVFTKLEMDKMSIEAQRTWREGWLSVSPV